MTLIEFVRTSKSNPERCLYVLYYEMAISGLKWMPTKTVRDKLVQARVPKASRVNVSDCLSRLGHLVDIENVGRERHWCLTQSGIEHIEDKLKNRLGEVPSMGRLLKVFHPARQIKILFLGLNPASEERIRLDEETREIETRLRASEFRGSFEFKSKWAVRPSDMFQYLNEIKPEIVHFSGHGTRTGKIAFEDSNGDAKFVSAEALGAAFETMKDNVRVVVLNTCYSNGAAKEISKSVDCVVGTIDAVKDRTSIQFSSSFYSALGFGHSVERAFKEARATLVMEGLPGDHLLQLHQREGVDAAKVVLID